MQHSTVDTIKKKKEVCLYSAGSKKKSVACHSWQVEIGENEKGVCVWGWKALMEFSQKISGDIFKIKVKLKWKWK